MIHSFVEDWNHDTPHPRPEANPGSTVAPPSQKIRDWVSVSEYFLTRHDIKRNSICAYSPGGRTLQ